MTAEEEPLVTATTSGSTSSPAIGAAAAALLYDRLYLRPLAPIPVGVPESGALEPRPGDAATE